MRRWLPYAIAGLVAALVLAGWGLVVVANSGSDTASRVDATATKVAAEPGHRAAADAELAAEIERQRAELARAAVERERLRQLVIANGGDPGPDLAVTVVAPSPRTNDDPSPRPPPSSRPPSAAPSRSPSPSPSPRRSCLPRVPPLPPVCR